MVLVCIISVWLYYMIIIIGLPYHAGGRIREGQEPRPKVDKILLCLRGPDFG